MDLGTRLDLRVYVGERSIYLSNSILIVEPPNSINLTCCPLALLSRSTIVILNFAFVTFTQ